VRNVLPSGTKSADVFVRLRYGDYPAQKTSVMRASTRPVKWGSSDANRFTFAVLPSGDALSVSVWTQGTMKDECLAILTLDETALSQQSAAWHVLRPRKSHRSARVRGQVRLVVRPRSELSSVGLPEPLSPPAAAGARDSPHERLERTALGDTFLRSASLPRLVEYATLASGADPVWLRTVFLLTHGDFSHVGAVLAALRDRHAGKNAPSGLLTLQQTRVLQLLEQWLRQSSVALTRYPQAADVDAQLRAFIGDVVAPTHARDAAALLSRLDGLAELRALHQSGASMSTPAANDDDDASSRRRRKRLSLATVDVERLAAQMTYLESEIFCSVHPLEFVNWHRDDHSVWSPNLEHLTQHFNRTSAWIRTELCFQTRLAERKAMLAKCMALCRHLLALGNYNGLMEVLSALNSSSVRRMHSTFAGVEKSVQAKFRKVAAIMSHDANYHAYREHIAQSKADFVVPYVGIFLTDLRFLMDGSPSLVSAAAAVAASPPQPAQAPSSSSPPAGSPPAPTAGAAVGSASLASAPSADGDKLVNWQKFGRVGQIVGSLHRMQRASEIRPRSEMQLWLKSRQPRSEDECYEMSRRVDPRNYEELVEELISNERLLLRRIRQLERELTSAQSSLPPIDDMSVTERTERTVASHVRERVRCDSCDSASGASGDGEPGQRAADADDDATLADDFTELTDVADAVDEMTVGDERDVFADGDKELDKTTATASKAAAPASSSVTSLLCVTSETDESVSRSTSDGLVSPHSGVPVRAKSPPSLAKPVHAKSRSAASLLQSSLPPPPRLPAVEPKPFFVAEPVLHSPSFARNRQAPAPGRFRTWTAAGGDSSSSSDGDESSGDEAGTDSPQRSSGSAGSSNWAFVPGGAPSRRVFT
jgi:RasGEF domain